MRSWVIAIAAVIPTVARAGPAVQAPAPVADLVGRDVVLPKDGGEVAVGLELELSKRHLGSPTSVAPDVYFAVTDRITIGVIHSARSLDEIDAGDGLCFRGTAHGCPRAYDNTGLDVRYRLRPGRLAVAARARLVAGSFDPFKPSLRVGALIRATHGRLAAIADPQVQLGLSNRDKGNRDWVRIPIWLAIQPACGVAIMLRTGVDGEVATYHDTFAIPLGLDVTVRITPRVELSAFAGFPQLGGPQNNVATRVAWLTAIGRWP